MADDVIIRPSPDTPVTDQSHDAPSCAMLFAVAVTFIGAYMFGFSLGFVSPVTNPSPCAANSSGCDAAALDAEMLMSSEQVTWFAAAFAGGVGVGSMVAGYAADRYGKRRGLIIAHAAYLIGYLALVAAPPLNGATDNTQVVALLCMARVVMGIGGGFALCCTSYQTEVATSKLKGVLQSGNQIGVSAGLATVYVLGQFYSWRALSCVCVAVTATGLVGCAMIPESPTWLVNKGFIEDAERALKRLRSEGSDISDLMSQLLWHQNESIDEERARGDLKELFKRKERQRALFIGVVLVVLQVLSGDVIFAAYGGHVLAAVYPTDAARRYAAWGHGAGCAALLTGVALLQRCRRNVMFVGSSLGMIGGCAMMAAGLYDAAAPDAVFAAGFVAYCAAFWLGMGVVPWTVLHQLFHPKVRGTGVAICVSIYWVLCFPVVKTLRRLTAALGGGPDGLAVLTLLYAAAALSAAAFVLACVPETQGKSYLTLTRALLGYAGYEAIR